MLPIIFASGDRNRLVLERAVATEQSQCRFCKKPMQVDDSVHIDVLKDGEVYGDFIVCAECYDHAKIRFVQSLALVGMAVGEITDGRELKYTR